MKHLLQRLATVLDQALEFSRARNADGEFAPQEDGGPGPEAMARVYGEPAARAGETASRGSLGTKAMGLAAAAGGLAAAALLARRLRGRMRGV